jgi:septal ring factor EnvC (AmiA/AmiB activator)
MHDASTVVELRGPTFTLGRSPDCELTLSDPRISSRHCQLSEQQGTWGIQDLRSANRTFVNGTLLGEQARRLNHGDLVRLGAADAVLFEVRFVIVAKPAEPERIAAARGPSAGEVALRQKVDELHAELRARNAEVVRVSEQLKRMQGERAVLHGERMAHTTASQSAERASVALLDELAALRNDLAADRAELAASRDAKLRAERRIAELEAQLASAERRGRSEVSDGQMRTKDLESRLRMALSDLAVAREALATANANLTSLRAAYDGALARLEAARER